jgi:haloalkane dehalogenase
VDQPLPIEPQSGLAYRDVGAGAPVLFVHGYPESSFMWRHLLPALSASGRRAVAPDLAGFGDSPPQPPGTWDRHVERLERFRSGLGLRVALVVHD